MIEKNTLCVAMEFSRCVGRSCPREKPPEEDGLSKLSSVSIEVDIVLGDLVVRTTEVINGPEATGVIAPESLERR